VHIDRRHFVLGLVGLGVTACGSKGATTLAPVSGSSAPPATDPTAAPTTIAATSTTKIAPTTSVAPTTSAAPTGPARYVSRGAATTKRVALTFHTEGTVAQVGKLLDMAKSLDVPLTMMIVGKWVEQNRDLGRRIADAGHDVGNHTYSHLSLPDQKRDVVAQEIRQCATVLRDVTGSAGRWFRPSGSNSTTTLINEEAGKAGYPVVLGFDTDPLDYEDPGSAAVKSRVVASIQAGSLVSLHAQHQGTIDVFESMVAAIRDKGFTLVRASDIVVN
jgi:peptidoglycan/xylan/chitin deacetylase (PgdA/CDA1 family)